MLTSMFRSATLRLTTWYLLILVVVSIVFSLVIYQIASTEVQTRLEHFETNFQQYNGYTIPIFGLEEIKSSQVNQANANLFVELMYINIFVFAIGGLFSYFLARRSLQPIEKAHEAQSRFTSDASHELRTPLAVMKTEIEVSLRDESATTNTLRETLASNLEEVNKLSKLSAMLLNLSRLDHAKLEQSRVDLAKSTNHIANEFNKISNRISIKSAKNLIIRGNETAISELIRVLIDNALLYSPNDSVVNIKLSKQGEKAKFEITNLGPGIQPDKLPHIFDRFYRADLSRTSGEKKGYGLGLALAKSIVELHNGELTASSTPNQKTTFAFLLSLDKISRSKNSC